jgi:uncharacterized protein YegL
VWLVDGPIYFLSVIKYPNKLGLPMARRKKNTDKSSATRTTVVVVQDKSGSMRGLAQATISGFNEYKNDLKDKAEGEVRLTLTQFNSDVHTIVTAQPIAEVADLTEQSYRTDGMTALYDAVGHAVNETARAVGKSDKVLVVIMTDGYENSSREFNQAAIVALMDQKRAEGWEFIFLGAGNQSWATGQALGFTHDTTINYNSSAVHTRSAFAEVSRASRGVTQGKQAASYLRTSPIKANLEYEAGFVWTGSNTELEPKVEPKVQAKPQARKRSSSVK